MNVIKLCEKILPVFCMKRIYSFCRIIRVTHNELNTTDYSNNILFWDNCGFTLSSRKWYTGILYKFHSISLYSSILYNFSTIWQPGNWCWCNLLVLFRFHQLYLYSFVCVCLYVYEFSSLKLYYMWVCIATSTIKV